jgi:hypothetical protein
VTWLNDAVLLAPSMLLVAPVRWTIADANAFDLTLTDRGNTVGARVYVDERGAPHDFVTQDRYVRESDQAPWVRTPWSTPVDGWTTVNGRRRPTGAHAVWRLPEGDFEYATADLAAATVDYNVSPTAIGDLP